ncbi:lytic polysaccharide monooxygenase auxiliary activity family 9 protein [Streptomyces sp. S465]|uniref:lytic polysaccharide monooxygenase auxiliary activity family 9 protein n=1 Tax=Streptomyces sp. S465 TaxID=2979468 RepID=UPI0022A86522|nr:lytic polysaccharide monooxygenase [Streptomyces sp. S465]WAP58877.1 lytic polysaccharide monooxygenase [Streptomyces sp. S465]
MPRRLLALASSTRPPGRSRAPRSVLLVLLSVLPALGLVFFSGGSASAHGAPMAPGSRTYLCWKYSMSSTGEVKPTNPACKAAYDKSGATPFYNWFAVLRSDGAGRTEGFIPDGKLCSAAATVYDFSGFDLGSNDWPVTHLTSGASMQFAYNAWAAHPGSFRSYITKDPIDPTQSLSWDDLEDQPFSTVTNPPLSGQVGTVDGKYTWTANLPSGKSGRHIIYTVWTRSDSQETFYSCSDVVFDGGNGEVTVPGTTSSGGGDNGSDPADPPTASCSAAQKVTSTWNGGYQAEVTVTNTGVTPISAWMVDWTVPSGQRIDSVWNGKLTTTGPGASVTNADWNGSLATGASTTFGFTAGGGSPDTAAAPICMVH